MNTPQDWSHLPMPEELLEQPAQQEPVALDAIRLAYLPHDSDKQPGEVQEAFVKGWNGALDTLAKRGPLYTSPQPSRPMTDGA